MEFFPCGDFWLALRFLDLVGEEAEPGVDEARAVVFAVFLCVKMMKVIKYKKQIPVDPPKSMPRNSSTPY